MVEVYHGCIIRFCNYCNSSCWHLYVHCLSFVDSESKTEYLLKSFYRFSNRFYAFNSSRFCFPSWLCFGWHFIHVVWLYSFLCYGRDMRRSSLRLYNQNSPIINRQQSCSGFFFYFCFRYLYYFGRWRASLDFILVFTSRRRHFQFGCNRHSKHWCCPMCRRYSSSAEKICC